MHQTARVITKRPKSDDATAAKNPKSPAAAKKKTPSKKRTKPDDAAAPKSPAAVKKQPVLMSPILLAFKRNAENKTDAKPSTGPAVNTLQVRKKRRVAPQLVTSGISPHEVLDVQSKPAEPVVVIDLVESPEGKKSDAKTSESSAGDAKNQDAENSNPQQEVGC